MKPIANGSYKKNYKICRRQGQWASARYSWFVVASHALMPKAMPSRQPSPT